MPNIKLFLEYCYITFITICFLIVCIYIFITALQTVGFKLMIVFTFTIMGIISPIINEVN